MTKKFVTAECFPLGEILVEEMKARGMTVLQLAQTSGICPDRLSEILEQDRTAFLSEIGYLARAFGLSEMLLANLQLAYLKWKKAKP